MSSSDDANDSAADGKGSVARRLAWYALPVLGGILQYSAFAALEIWPLAFVCFVPTLYLIEKEYAFVSSGRDGFRGYKLALKVGFVHGFVGYVGGYSWLIEFLETFSGFGTFASTAFASIFFAYHGLQQMLIVAAYVFLRRKRAPAALAFVVAFMTFEWLFPDLFPSFMATGFHNVMPFIQSADIGGPLLISFVACFPNGVVINWIGWKKGWMEDKPWRSSAVALAMLALNVGYGFYRLAEVDVRAEAADKLETGMVQVGMGVFEKRQNPREGLDRHLSQSRALESDGPLDLLVWPESAATFAIPERIHNVKNFVTPDLKSPVLFGGLALRDNPNPKAGDKRKERLFNTAYLTDAQGNVLSTYDKTFLLAFGEYLPFGDTFPILYEWSPNTGRFDRGSHQDALVLNVKGRDARISTLICYEDVLPGFTRQAVAIGKPDILINITNDAWFSGSEEPYVHLALAKFRAIEHHRALVRATNSGISAFIDPAGRVLSSIPDQARGQERAALPLMDKDTLYLTLGDWPGYLTLLLALGVVIVDRKRREAL